MSAIFGIFHHDGRPIDGTLLTRMDAALSDWGPNEADLCIDGPIGLGCRLVRITAEDAYEQQPLRDGDHLLAAHVRLDNRADLCRDLNIADRPDLPDSALLVAAYRRYGLDCVDRLQGDWVFALWDRPARRLVLARCATGNAGLYWWRRGPCLLFATSVGGLLAHPDCTPALNERHIASLSAGYEDPEENATAYRDVVLLEPGHLLIVTSDGVEQRPWWRPEELEPLRFSDREQYYRAFRELYATVVGQHLRVGDGGIAATLSGGLDSGSVVAMAAPSLTRPLTAYVHTPLYEPVALGRRIGNELPQAACTAAHVGNVDLRPLASPDVSIMAGIRHGLRLHSLPTYAAANEYWIADILGQAQQAGARVLLTGQGGNATVSYSGTGNLLPRLRSGQIPAILAELAAERNGLWLGLKRRLIKPAAQPLRDALHRRPTYAGLLSPALRQTLPPPHSQASMDARTIAFRLGRQGAGRGRLRWMAAGAAHGLAVRDPTRDRRIVEFCWRVPDDVFWANGRQRGLIRAGLADDLPANILHETRKGLQSSDILGRLRAQAAEIDAALDRIGNTAVARDYFDVNALRSMFIGILAAENSITEVNRAHVFCRNLGIGDFLALQDP